MNCAKESVFIICGVISEVTNNKEMYEGHTTNTPAYRIERR